MTSVVIFAEIKCRTDLARFSSVAVEQSSLRLRTFEMPNDEDGDDVCRSADD